MIALFFFIKKVSLLVGYRCICYGRGSACFFLFFWAWLLGELSHRLPGGHPHCLRAVGTTRQHKNGERPTIVWVKESLPSYRTCFIQKKATSIVERLKNKAPRVTTLRQRHGANYIVRYVACFVRCMHHEERPVKGVLPEKTKRSPRDHALPRRRKFLK